LTLDLPEVVALPYQLEEVMVELGADVVEDDELEEEAAQADVEVAWSYELGEGDGDQVEEVVIGGVYACVEGGGVQVEVGATQVEVGESEVVGP
jgi:hypothetical protein